MSERQLLFILRHATDCLDNAWKKANANPEALGISGRGPEKNIPVIKAALEECDVLVRKILSNLQIVAALKGGPIKVFSSRKLRAQQSVKALSIYMGKYHRTLWLEPTQYTEALDGRNYGFTWHRTLQGIRAVSEEAYRRLEEDFYTYRPWGGESWVDVVSRVFRFVQEVILPSQKHIILMTHHELVPIIEGLLLGMVPGPLTIKNGNNEELPNAAARVWVRRLDGNGLWRPYGNKTIIVSTRRDYSREPEVVAQQTPPTWSGVVCLDEYREERRKRRHG